MRKKAKKNPFQSFFASVMSKILFRIQYGFPSNVICMVVATTSKLMPLVIMALIATRSISFYE